MTEAAYTPEFFAWAIDRARTSAAMVVPLVLERVEPRSVVDFGCGIGVWLEAFAHAGVTDFVGVDGEWVPREALLFPEERFVSARLDRDVDLQRHFDLAVALEVAEHLPEHRAKHFVRTLVDHAPCVLFSAAVPHQGGTDHVNEQWPDYWADLFTAQGYVAIDGIRPLIWSNRDVLPFYRQNILMFGRADIVESGSRLRRDRERTVDDQLSLVHPELLESLGAHATEHVRRPSARDLMLSELARAAPTIVVRSAKWRLTRLTSRRRRRDSRP